MLDQIIEIENTFENDISSVPDLQKLEQLRLKYLGKKGLVSVLSKGLKNVSSKDRGKFGKRLNECRGRINEALAKSLNNLHEEIFHRRMESERIDVTINKKPQPGGSFHPISLMQYRLEDIFSSMGFLILDGPHVESEYYNFEALNIPKEHPARDMQDTFFLNNGQLLRTQTSTIQIRGMESHKPPIRFIGPGKVFRAERTDASHDSVFHQLEGMMIDKNISVANLIYFTKIMLSEIFERELEVRLRPGYFPFVEPGFELDISCQICTPKTRNSCKACKGIGWLELLGCGMVHPNVLRAGGIDPEKYSGFAFGLGIDRLAMMKYGIDDIRHLHSGDIRFSEQFSGA